MKNLLLFTLLGALLLTSCGGDDSISGTWVVTSLSSTSCDDPEENQSSSAFSTTACTATSIDECLYISYTFTETTLATVTSFAFQGMVSTETDSGTYTTDGDQITICDAGDCDTATYTIDGDTMTITGTDPDDGCVTRITAVRQ